jgi:hypothetical protein
VYTRAAVAANIGNVWHLAAACLFWQTLLFGVLALAIDARLDSISVQLAMVA